MLYISLDFCRL